MRRTGRACKGDTLCRLSTVAHRPRRDDNTLVPGTANPMEAAGGIAVDVDGDGDTMVDTEVA